MSVVSRQSGLRLCMCSVASVILEDAKSVSSAALCAGRRLVPIRLALTNLTFCDQSRSVFCSLLDVKNKKLHSRLKALPPIFMVAKSSRSCMYLFASLCVFVCLYLFVCVSSLSVCLSACLFLLVSFTPCDAFVSAN